MQLLISIIISVYNDPGCVLQNHILLDHRGILKKMNTVIQNNNFSGYNSNFFTI
jgi:hypothetical protein